MVRYLSGLCVCGLGLVAGGWLVVAAVLLRGAPSSATLATASTGAGVALVSAVGVACWSAAWRQRMRLDGVLPGRAGRLPAGTVSAGTVPAGTVSAGTVSAGTARRNRRALRRDMRHAARIAREDRRDDAPHLAGAVPPADVVPLTGTVPPAGPVPPADVVPLAGTVPPAGTARPDSVVLPGRTVPADSTRREGSGCPAVTLTELRAILEPLLTTGPMKAVPGADTDGEEAW